MSKQLALGCSVVSGPQRYVLLLLMAAIVAGCASGTSKRSAPPSSRYLVAGEIRLETPLKDVFVYARGKANVGRQEGLRRWIYPDGSFMLSGLPEGDYYIAGFADHAHTYWIEYAPADLARATVRVGETDVAFLGLHEVRDRGAQGFDFVRIRGDGERAVLERLAAKADGAEWLPAVRKKLNKLD